MERVSEVSTEGQTHAAVGGCWLDLVHFQALVLPEVPESGPSPKGEL